jgi:hypothetical protein
MLGELKFALLQKGLVVTKGLDKKQNLMFIRTWKGGITKRENPKTKQIKYVQQTQM